MDEDPRAAKDWPHQAVIRSRAQVADAQIWCTQNAVGPHMSYYPRGFEDGPCFCFIDLASAQALVDRFGGRLLTPLEKEEIEAVDAVNAPLVPDLRAYYETVADLESDIRGSAAPFMLIVEDAEALGLVSRSATGGMQAEPLKQLIKRCGRILSGAYVGPFGEHYYLCELPKELPEGDAEAEEAFDVAKPGVLEEMCMEGYLDDGRPEDEVAFLLDDNSPDNLSQERLRLYEERLLPLMRLWFFHRARFDDEYARLRASWLQS